MTTNQNCHIFSSVNLPALSTRMCTSRCSQEQALTNEATEHHLSNVKTFFYIFNSTKIVLHLIALAYIYSTIQNQRLHLALIRTCLPHTHTHTHTHTHSTKTWQHGVCIFHTTSTILICENLSFRTENISRRSNMEIPHSVSLLDGLELCTSHVRSISTKPLTRAAELCDAVPKGACLQKNANFAGENEKQIGNSIIQSPKNVDDF